MIQRHVVRCLIAGFVALLPVGGLVLMVVYLESTLAASWLARQPFYFPGAGILAALLVLYAIGLLVTTFLGRWLWGRADRLLDRLPAFGAMYRSLKQILGYGRGDDALFREVVLVASDDTGGTQLGLVTSTVGHGDGERRVVFVPGAPNPAAGRLLLLPPAALQPLQLQADDVLKALLSLGKTSLDDLIPAR